MNNQIKLNVAKEYTKKCVVDKTVREFIQHSAKSKHMSIIEY